MQAARAQAEDFRHAFRVAAARPSDRTCERFADALDDDFDTPQTAFASSRRPDVRPRPPDLTWRPIWL